MWYGDEAPYAPNYMDVAAEASFEAAHMLSGYDGDCHNIHGHSYKVRGGCIRFMGHPHAYSDILTEE